MSTLRAKDAETGGSRQEAAGRIKCAGLRVGDSPIIMYVRRPRGMSGSDRTFLRRAIWGLLAFCLLLNGGLAEYLLSPYWLKVPRPRMPVPYSASQSTCSHRIG